MKRKLIKIGNSLGFTLEAYVANKCELKAGDEIPYEYSDQTGQYNLFLKGVAPTDCAYEIPEYLNVRMAQQLIQYLKDKGPQQICNCKFLYPTHNRLNEFNLIKDHFLKTGNLVMIDHRMNWYDNPLVAPKPKYKPLSEAEKAELSQENAKAMAALGLKIDGELEEILDADIVDEKVPVVKTKGVL